MIGLLINPIAKKMTRMAVKNR